MKEINILKCKFKSKIHGAFSNIFIKMLTLQWILFILYAVFITKETRASVAAKDIPSTKHIPEMVCQPIASSSLAMTFVTKSYPGYSLAVGYGCLLHHTAIVYKLIEIHCNDVWNNTVNCRLLYYIILAKVKWSIVRYSRTSWHNHEYLRRDTHQDVSQKKIIYFHICMMWGW